MIQPATLRKQPSMGMALLGAVVATILLSSSVLLLAQLGVNDFPSLIGGIFTGDPTVAFYLGFSLFFLAGITVFSLPLLLIWGILPGQDEGLLGAIVKGAFWGLILWAITGVLLPLLDYLSALETRPIAGPGFFAVSFGLLGPLALLLAALAYGIALAVVMAMGQGITPLDTPGWEGYQSGEEQNEAIY